MSEIAAEILELCQREGFALAGICPAEPTRYPRELHAWIDADQHGEMSYLEQYTGVRIDPRKFVMQPGESLEHIEHQSTRPVRSIICVADRYSRPGSEAHDPDQPRGRVARYARGNDYHNVMKKRLMTVADILRERFPDEQFRVCVDTAPVLEREHAARAGLGAVGKHTLLIEQGVSSYLLLGEILTSLELQPANDVFMHDPVDPCGSCTRCIEACPTDAITPWSVDATRCISYLTIEHRSVIDQQFHEPMGDWIFGCDICQNVCPHNQPTRRKRRAALHEAYEPKRDSFDLLDVLNWTEADRREAFQRSAMKRAKLFMMKRNALIAAGNFLAMHRSPALHERIQQIADDEGEHEVVRETAKQVLARLKVQ